MSELWCGCGNYQWCSRCLNNVEGDLQKEHKRVESEKASKKRNAANELQRQINHLTSLKRLLEE